MDAEDLSGSLRGAERRLLYSAMDLVFRGCLEHLLLGVQDRDIVPVRLSESDEIQ